MNYGYDDRYLFEFNIRHDGSSRMPKANRYATFPSVSGGWVFSNEELMKDYKNFSLGKLRLSWGKLGNQEIGNYAYAATLGASGNYFFDQGGDKQAGMVQTSVPNEDINGKRPAPSMWPLILDSLIIGYRLLLNGLIRKLLIS